MPKFRNKKSLKNIRRQANRRREANKNEETMPDKKTLLITLILFASGIALAFIHSGFAMLTMLFPAMVGAYICDKISKAVFGKEFEYYMDYSGKQMKWSDIFLSIPLLLFILYPMFIIGEVADCHLGTQFWTNTLAICR